jgi:[acyl-carrier-protein] S-malonyltransferase
MKVYVFPGQGAQYPGMGKDLYEKYPVAKEMFDTANHLLGFRITDIMFDGTEEDLRQTKVTQPAVFLHSVILAFLQGKEFQPKMVAGHSLGEFSALVTSGVLSFDDGLLLVSKRALAMQKACELQKSTMAAILGLEDSVVEEVCKSIPETVVPANYNSVGQIVISGTVEGVAKAIEELKVKGAKRAIPLAVSGGFHSPCMEPARVELEEAILATKFNKPICPVYQNVTASPEEDTEVIKKNLILQLTSPVRWTQTIINMGHNGADHFIESGPGNVLQGLIKKIMPSAIVDGLKA